MGMDVFGNNPKSKKGEYFQNSVWGWRPLWNYCVEVGDGIIPAEGAEKGHYNDGWGLDDEGAQQLAKRLQERIATGQTKQYAAERDEYLKNLPDEPCDICDGTGRRANPPKTGPGKHPCNGCNGTGNERPWETNYDFEEENVREFADFLEDSGGFKIY